MAKYSDSLVGECALTGHGIQHRDGILLRNLSVFIPFTLVQQNGSKISTLDSGFEKTRFPWASSLVTCKR